MTNDPSYALQVAVVAALKASSAVTCPVYDRVPTGAAFPYLNIGDNQVMAEYYGLEAWSECHVNVHVWSQPSTAPGKGELLTLCGAVRDALDTQLSLTGFNCIVWKFMQTRTMLDQDGITEHGIVEMYYEVQPQAA